MYARGQGIPLDLPRGMAWMALAAERNEKRYVDAREAVYAEMTPEQFQQANEIWRELKKTYGDEVALRRAKARWAQVKSSMFVIGRVATPESIAAWATAGASETSRRGSNGCGIRYSGPNVSCWSP